MTKPMRAMSMMAVLWLMACGGSSQRPPVQTASNACAGDASCAGGVCVAGVCRQCRDDGACGGGRCVDGRCVAPQVARTETNPTVTVQPDGGACFERVYFDFDDAQLTERARTALQRTAECLRREVSGRVVLMGHADPRGSVEYNLALGHRRAQSVMNYLVALGVPDARLAASSVGSEYAEGSDEETWARDRRVEFSDRQGAHARTR